MGSLFTMPEFWVGVLWGISLGIGLMTSIATLRGRR
jgi:hypothetical protein